MRAAGGLAPAPKSAQDLNRRRAGWTAQEGAAAYSTRLIGVPWSSAAGPRRESAERPARSLRLPAHQFLGGLLVVFEEFAVILALDDLRVERQRLGLGLVLLRTDGLLEMADQRGLDGLGQAGRRRDAARHRPHLVEALLAKGGAVGNERRAFGRHHPEDAELAGLDVLCDLADVACEHFDVAGQHLGLAFRRAAEMHHLEARSVVGADAQCGDVIVGAVAAAV